MVFEMARGRFANLLIASVVIPSGPARGDERPLRAYFVGNGVTDTRWPRAGSERMRMGKVPGVTDIGEIYVDGIHINDVGSFVVSTTFYAKLFRDDPRGIAAGHYNEKVDPKMARAIEGQKTS